jgi:hypothetical protein
MDPRVAITSQALEQQYALAHAIASLMDRSFDAAASAKKTGNAKAAAEFSKLNSSLGDLLDTVEGADAPPTRQAIVAADTLTRQFAQAEAHP